MTIEKEISKIIGGDGKSQILLKLTIDRTNRPRIKTGVFIKPEYFKKVNTSSRGSKFDIVIPKKSKFNSLEVQEVAAAKNNLEEFVLLLQKIESIYFQKQPITKDLLCACIDIVKQQHFPLSTLTFEQIEEQRNKKNVAKKHVRAPKKLTTDDYIDEYCKDNKISKSRIQCYEVLKRMIRRFELYKQKLFQKSYTFDFLKADKTDIADFKDFIANEIQLEKQYPTTFEEIQEIIHNEYKIRKCTLTVRSGNYICITLKKLCAIFNWLLHRHKISINPFEDIDKGKEQYGSPIYISVEERNTIADHDFSTDLQLDLARDMFVFQCYIGCRVSDLLTLTEDNIYNGFIEYVPDKTVHSTGVKARIPLAKKAIAIIEKYKECTTRGKKLLPFMDSVKYNELIKVVFKSAGIVRKVQWFNPKTNLYETKSIADIASSHMARRTFAGAAYKAVKDPNIVCKMTGHVEGSKAFLRYRNVDDDMLKDVIKAIE